MERPTSRRQETTHTSTILWQRHPSVPQGTGGTPSRARACVLTLASLPDEDIHQVMEPHLGLHPQPRMLRTTHWGDGSHKRSTQSPQHRAWSCRNSLAGQRSEPQCWGMARGPVPRAGTGWVLFTMPSQSNMHVDNKKEVVGIWGS